MYYLIGLGLIAVYYLLSKKQENNTNETNLNYSNIKLNFAYLNSLPNPVKTFINSVFTRFPFEYFDKFNVNLPIALIYSVLYNESRGQIINNVPNNLIIGDNGLSIGFMQVHKHGAVKEYAQTYGRNFEIVFQEVHDETKNFIVGLFYLNLCYQKSLKDSNNIIHTTLKRYNGGIGQKEGTTNPQANNYANKGIEIYNHLMKVLS